MTLEFIEAAKRFLCAALEQEPPSAQHLLLASDKLALAIHSAPEGEQADSDVDTPGREYNALYKKVGARFPDFGFYASADPAEIVADPLVGDAIDDIVDVCLELSEVIWRYETLGPSEASWWFRFMYDAHWGLHLRHLALYLHVQNGKAD